MDPYPDVAWLLGGEGSWTGYSDDTLNEALTKSQLTSDPEETKELFSVVDKKVQEDVPMFSAYVISAQGASASGYRRNSQRIRLLQRMSELDVVNKEESCFTEFHSAAVGSLRSIFIREKRSFLP